MRGKIVLLLVVLIVPFGIGLFIKSYAPERPKLKRYFPITEGFESDYTKEVKGKKYHIVPPFKFTAQDSTEVTEKTFENKIFVADFFFTRCPGVCPKLTRSLTRVQEMFGEEESIMILSHTVDPEHDTPEVLTDYAKRFNADTKQWLFVTGDSETIYEQAEYGYYLYAAPGEDGSAEEFDHSGKLILVDRDRIIRGYYDGTVDSMVNKLMFDIKVLQLEYPQGENKKIKYKVTEKEQK